MPCSACSPDGVPITTMSSERCASISSRESYAVPPCRAANCSACARVGAYTDAISTAPIVRSARACVSLMLPAPIRPTWIVIRAAAARAGPSSHRAGFLQQRLHSGEALAARCFGGAGAAPVRFESDRVAVAVALQRAELSGPIDHTAAHRLPFPLAARAARRVLAVHVADAPFRNRRVTAGKGHLVAKLCVAWIPCDLQRRILNRGSEASGFGAGRGVAGVFVLEDKGEALLRRLRRRLSHDIVDSGAMRLLILEPPEVEHADAV